MRSVIFSLAVAALAATAIGTAPPASAQEYPWCAHYGGFIRDWATNCGFNTRAQCQATVSGIGGYCAPNPRYAAARQGRGKQSQQRY